MAKLSLCYLTHFNSILYNHFSNWTVSMTTPIFSAYIFLFSASADFFFLFIKPFQLFFFCLCSKVGFGELNMTFFQFFSSLSFWMVMLVWILQNQSLKNSGRGCFMWAFSPNATWYIYFILLFYLRYLSDLNHNMFWFFFSLWQEVRIFVEIFSFTAKGCKQFIPLFKK